MKGHVKSTFDTVIGIDDLVHHPGTLFQGKGVPALENGGQVTGYGIAGICTFSIYGHVGIALTETTEALIGPDDNDDIMCTFVSSEGSDEGFLERDGKLVDLCLKNGKGSCHNGDFKKSTMLIKKQTGAPPGYACF